MDCCIVDYEGDGEPIDPCTITTPVARKEHVCGECRETIKVGETYERVEGLCDGAPFSHKTCTGCLRIRKQYFCGGWGYGNIWEDMKYALEEYGEKDANDPEAAQDETWLPRAWQSHAWREAHPVAAAPEQA
jgi:hypothetical protein